VTGKSGQPVGSLCPAPFVKIFPFAATPNQIYIPRRPVPQRGVGHRHERWGGMRWTRMHADERAFRGRRSRVVLTPRRWRQVGGSNPAGDGGKKARSPGSNCILK
jgi:hypothetical protein